MFGGLDGGELISYRVQFRCCLVCLPCFLKVVLLALLLFLPACSVMFMFLSVFFCFHDRFRRSSSLGQL